MNKVKKMDIKEFQEKGFLQEVNRLFFHPLGLALEVSIDDFGNYSLGGVWDYREDPDGIIYGDVDEELNLKRIKKRDFIRDYSQIKFRERKNKLGYVVQPIKEINNI